MPPAPRRRKLAIVRALLLALCLAGCARSESTASTKQPIAEAPELVEARFGAKLTRTAWIARGNHHPVARFLARGRDLGEGMFAALTPDSAVIVRADGTLESNRVLARTVLPDVAVSNDGAIAYVGAEGLHLLDERGERRLVSAFSDADRPLFLDEHTLLFVGAAKPGVSSFYRLPLDTEMPEPFPTDAIPASRDGYRVETGVVYFHDGVAMRHVP